MEAIILAGGMGTRLGRLTKELPKPMLRFNKRPFLEHLMDYWIHQGVTKIILSVGYKYECIKEYFGHSYKKIPITYSVEAKPLGTGGALELAMAYVQTKESLLLLNGDTFFAVSLSELIKQHKKFSANVTLSLFQSREKNRYEQIKLLDQKVVDVVKRSESESLGAANGGVYLIRKDFLKNEWNSNLQAHSLENDDLMNWVKDDRAVYGYIFDEDFMDIGTPEDYAKTEEFLNKRMNSKGEAHV